MSERHYCQNWKTTVMSRGRHSVGSILTTLWTDDRAFVVWFPSWARRSVRIDSATNPTSSVGTGALSRVFWWPVVKLALLPSIADVEKKLSCIFAPYAVMACTGKSFL